MWQETITRYTLGVSIMFSFYWLSKRFIVSPLLDNDKLPKDKKVLLKTILLYLPGLCVMWLLLKSLPVFRVAPKSFTAGNYLVVFFAQFFAFIIMAVFSLLEIKLGLLTPEILEKKEKENYKGLNALLLILIVPLLEELFNRKILGNILGTEHIRLFIYMSALTFSLIHLQTGRIAVAAGTFYVGFLWAWVYAASGSLLLCTLYHGLYNLMMVFIPEYLQETKDKRVHNLFIAGLILAGSIGFMLFTVNMAHYLPTEFSGAQNL
jgi:membrane protease YdiL (CAAX protease family)